MLNVHELKTTLPVQFCTTGMMGKFSFSGLDNALWKWVPKLKFVG